MSAGGRRADVPLLHFRPQAALGVNAAAGRRRLYSSSSSAVANVLSEHVIPVGKETPVEYTVRASAIWRLFFISFL